MALGAEVECKLPQLDGRQYSVDVDAYDTVVFAASPLNERYVGKDPELQHHKTFWKVTCQDTDLPERLAQEKDFYFVGESRGPQ